MHQSLRLGILSGLEHPKLAAAKAAVNGSLPLLRVMVQAAAMDPDEKRILPVFYYHLDPTKIPSEDEMDMEILATDTVDTITRALLCVEGLYNLTTFPPGTHFELYQCVWPWAHFLDAHGSRILDAPAGDVIRARVFCIIVNFDKNSGTKASAPEVGILAAQVWSDYFREPNPTSELALRRLTALFGVNDEYDLDHFIEGAGSIDALAILVVKLVHYVLNSDFIPEIKTMNLGGVLAFSKRSKDHAWLSALRSHKFIAAIISALLFVERLIEVPTEKVSYVYNQAWLTFFRLSGLNSGYTGVVEAVNAGILQLIASIIGRNLQWTETIIHGMITFTVQPATVYYPVLAAIEHILPLAQQAISAPALKSSALYPDWQKFVRIALDRLDIKKKFDSRERISRKTCDNPECGKILRKTDFKRCSDCKQQLYCSKECQNNDWRASHRELCQYTRRPESPAHLTNRDKAFLRFLVAHDYEQHKQDIFLARIVGIRRHGANLVTFFDYSNGGLRIDVGPLKEEGDEDHNDPDYLVRVRRSGGRMHPIVVQITTGQTSLQTGQTSLHQWIISIRSSSSEVHDKLLQLSP
ncbi:MYND-type domain-containing protein [Mycena sanguinolenta]|uniref:MYND-type domain-containing protein n=1 Tax=Mycena sanguinolenta TaxID=230812 RepID=A0A8H7D9Q9_9AGAR|nr:MYND-type domain-containing protein [Mycena sanguinolenta]